MNLKQYVKQLAKDNPADSEEPAVIVQHLACLAATNLAAKGKLPNTCGRGGDIDLDIVNAGIVAGLEKIRMYDGTLGTLRAFLYKTIAGTIQNYAWARENRVQDNANTDLSKIQVFDDVASTTASSGIDDDEGTTPKSANTFLVDQQSPDKIIEQEQDEQEGESSAKARRAVYAYLGKEDSAMLLKDAQIGYNGPRRRQWASELGISPGALNMRLVRLRKRARDWALRQH